jgi:hypothetical protein
MGRVYPETTSGGRPACAGGAGSLALALGASASHAKGSSQSPVFRSSLAPCISGGPTVHGVGPCLDSWSLENGSVRLGQGGSFELEVGGLVITATGMTAPVTGISAALFCGADSNTTPAATTGVVPLSTDGTRRSRQPSRCRAPVSRRSSSSTSRKVRRSSARVTSRSRASQPDLGRAAT